MVSAYGDSRTAPLIAPVCVVTVEAAAVQESVTLDETELKLTVGGEKTLVATATPEDAEVEWSSSDSTVATVENGKVTAVKAGTTTITAKVGSATATCSVTVEAAPAIACLSALNFVSGTTASADAYTLQPAFNPNVREYTLIVPDGKASSASAVYALATLGEGISGDITIAYTDTASAAKTR